MTESQRQFEEWARSVSHNMVPGGSLDRPYLSYETQIAYEAWQASREAAVVKLPDIFDGSPDNATYYDYMYRKTEMEKALDDAGIEYE